jgi:hypothetical protein
VSVSNSAVEGFISRLVVRNGRIYAATFRKGIQVVDIEQAKQLFVPCCASEHWRMIRSLNTDGQGHGQGAVVNTIDVKNASGSFAWLTDLKVGEYVVDGFPQVLALAVGDVGLVIADPQQGRVTYQGALVTNNEGTRLIYGEALALGRLSDRPVALVSGTGLIDGASSRMLVIVDLSNAARPVVMSVLPLTEMTYDILLKGDVAYIGGASHVTLINVSNPWQTRLIGEIAGVSQRLALTEDGLLLSTARSLFGGQDPMGGIRIATLRRLVTVSVSSDNWPVLFDGLLSRTADPVRVAYRVIPSDAPAKTMSVKIFRGEAPVQELLAPFNGLEGETTWAAGTPIQPAYQYYAQAQTDAGTPDEMVSYKAPIPISDIKTEFSKDLNALVAYTMDGQTIIENTWDKTGSGMEPPINGYDYKTSTRTYTKAIASLNLKPPRRPSDYMLLKIHSGGVLVWESSGQETLRVPVPDDTGRIEAKLKATRELAPLTVQRVKISVE